MHNFKRLFAVGTLCLVLSLLLTSPVLAHGHRGGHRGGGHCGGWSTGGYDSTAYDTADYSEESTDSGYPYGEYNRQWICGGRWQTEIPVCAVEGCTAAGRHLHDSILYCGYAHDGGFCNGACCGLCPVEGCAFAGRHLHDGMVYCGASHTAGFCGGDCAVYHHGY